MGHHRRKEENRMRLDSSNLLSYKENRNNINFRVGFITNKTISKRIRIIQSILDRVAHLVLDMSRTSLKIIHVYASTTAHNDEDITENH